MDVAIVNLASLSVDEIASLAAGGINNGDDLMVMEFADIVAILPTANILKQRKLAQIARYLAMGNTVEVSTTIADIMQCIATPTVARAIGGARVPAAEDPARGAPKIYVNYLEKFSGIPIDFEEWKISTTQPLERQPTLLF